jgi:hypothetical protein
MWIGWSAFGRRSRNGDTLLMALQHEPDLTNEIALLAKDRVENDTSGIRALLCALQLMPVSGPMVDTPEGDVSDLAMYRAPEDRRLATIGGTAA